MMYLKCTGREPQEMYSLGIKQWGKLFVLLCVACILTQLCCMRNLPEQCRLGRKSLPSTRTYAPEYHIHIAHNVQHISQVVKNSSKQPIHMDLFETDESGRILSDMKRNILQTMNIASGRKPYQLEANKSHDADVTKSETAVNLQKLIHGLAGHTVQILKYRIRSADIPQSLQFPESRECDKFTEDWQGNWPVMRNVFGAYITDPSAVTMVTQISVDRLAAFERSLNFWKGPVSAAIYGNYTQLCNALERLKTVIESNMRYNLFIHVVLRGNEFHYPGNLLRNIAVENVETEFSFLNDGDFLPSTNAEARLSEYKQQLQQKQVFVLPAFAFLENHSDGDFRVLESKDKLVENLKSKNTTIMDFAKYNYEIGHRKTNYRYWQTSNKIYKIIYEMAYEPYVLMFTTDVMHYPEMFLGWYYDKMSMFLELACTGYTYFVLPDVYVVHQYHPPSSKAALQYYKCSVAVKMTWLDLLKQRYRMQHFPWEH